MKKTDAQEWGLAQIRAIQAKAEELRKMRGGTARYRDALESVGINQGTRIPATRGYLNTLKMHRPGHYERFLEDQAAMMAYVKGLEDDRRVVAPEEDKQMIEGNVVYGAFPDHARSQQRKKSLVAQGRGISPLQRAMLEIGIVPPATVLRLVKRLVN